MIIGFDVSQTGQFKTGCGYYADSLARALIAADTNNAYVLYPTFGTGFWDADWPNAALKLPGRANVSGGLGHRRLDLLEAFWLDPPTDQELQLGRPDVIHSNNFYCPTSLKRARLVYTLHDLAFASHPEWTSDANWRVCFTGVFDASIYADHVLAVSEFTRGQFLDLFPHFPADRISVAYEASRFPLSSVPATPRPSDVAHLSAGEFWLASGDPGPRKNLDRLLDAYARLRANGETTFPLVLFGGPRTASRPTPGVQRLGYVDDVALQWLYANCTAFCYPSLFEGFGLPVVEAMSLGAAVLTSNATSLPEVVGDSAALVDPLDVEAIHASLRLLATDQHLRQNLRAASRERARRFAWRATADHVLSVYDAVVNEYPRFNTNRSTERKPVGV